MSLWAYNNLCEHAVTYEKFHSPPKHSCSTLEPHRTYHKLPSTSTSSDPGIYRSVIKTKIVFVSVDPALRDYCHVVDNKSPLFLQNLMMQCNNKSPLLLQEYSNAGQDMERFRASLRAMMYPYSPYTPLL